MTGTKDEEGNGLEVGAARAGDIPTSNMYHQEAHEPEYDELHVPCPPHTTEKELTRRVDFHLIPFLVILYLMAFLDRVNIANARSFHLIDDLNLGGVQYNTALTIFFVPYVIFEIPSNILLKRFSPRIWLSACCLGFGLVTVLQGLTQSYGGLLATRFFLGVFETGMFPGCFYLLGKFSDAF
jgi:sugar phosphate permease